MTVQDWPDPRAATVERALAEAGFPDAYTGRVLADEVRRLRAQITALTAEHSGACDDMAVCGNCWTAERIDAAARAEAQVEAVRSLHSRDEKKLVYGVEHCVGCATHVTYTEWPCKTIQALDVPLDVTQ